MQFEVAMTLRKNYVNTDCPIAGASLIMVATRGQFLPVLKGRLAVGVVTRHDLLNRCKGLDARRTPTTQIMSLNPAFVYLNVSADEIADTMLLHKFKNVLVLRPDQTLLGVANAERILPYVKDAERCDALLRLCCDSPPKTPSILPGNFWD